MFELQGIKIMLDLHGLSVKEVKKLLEEHFAKIKDQNIDEFYLITGRGNHIPSNGSRGVLKKILPKLLKPYCKDIIQINPEDGAYKIILKPQQNLTNLKNVLSSILVDENDQIEFINILKLDAEKNDIDAILTLAGIYLCQSADNVKNIKEGERWLLKAKELGSLEAYVQLGILYHEGISGIKQDHQKAFKLFQYAANKEHPVAQYYLAVCYLHGKGVKYSNKNDELAVFWMKKSADQNDVYAQATVSDFYLLGKITNQDMKLGHFYKKKAAEQGFVAAQIDLARCYATGYGVKQDYSTAFKWYQSAAQSNDPYAVYQVGAYLLNGLCGNPNPTEAFPYFLRAAKFGDADGQIQVGLMMTEKEYSKYSNIPYDLEEGIKWLRMAKAQKNLRACEILEEMQAKSISLKNNQQESENSTKFISSKLSGSEDLEKLNKILNAFKGKGEKGTPTPEVVLRRVAAGLRPQNDVDFDDSNSLIQYLITKVSDINACSPTNEMTALHHAVKNNQIKIASILLLAGAKYDIKDKDKKTANDYALELPNKEMKKLFKSTDMLEEIQARNIPIMSAIIKRNMDQLKQLIQEKVDVNIYAPGGRKTPLHLAVELQQEAMVELLLESNASANAITKTGKTPLNVAAQMGNVCIMKKLIDAGAQINLACNVGCTPLHEASAKGHQDAVVMLVTRGANVNLKDYRLNLTAYELACFNKKQNIMDILNPISINNLIYKPAIDLIKTAFGPKYNNSVKWEIHTAQNDIYAKVNTNFSFEKDAKLFAEKLHSIGITKAFSKQDGKGWTLIVPNLEEILSVFKMQHCLQTANGLNNSI